MNWRITEPTTLERIEGPDFERLEALLAQTVHGAGAECGAVLCVGPDGAPAFAVTHSSGAECPLSADWPPAYESVRMAPLPDSWHRMTTGLGIPCGFSRAPGADHHVLRSVISAPVLQRGRIVGSVSVGAWRREMPLAPEAEALLRSALAALSFATSLLCDRIWPELTPGVDLPPPRYPLSQRQLEVLELFVHGLRVPTIAERLYLSQHTVRNHLKAIFRSYGVASQTELMVLVEGHRLRTAG